MSPANVNKKKISFKKENKTCQVNFRMKPSTKELLDKYRTTSISEFIETLVIKEIYNIRRSLNDGN